LKDNLYKRFIPPEEQAYGCPSDSGANKGYGKEKI
jgi:hypothetical protein